MLQLHARVRDRAAPFLAGEEKRTLSGHSREVMACSFSPDGGSVVSGSKDETLKIWDAVTGDLMSTLVGHTAEVCSCRWAGPEMVVSSSDDGSTRWWAKQQGDEYANVAAFFSSSPATALGVCGAGEPPALHGMVVVGNKQGAVMIVKLNDAEAMKHEVQKRG